MTVETPDARMSEQEARRLTQRITLLLDAASSTLDKLAAAIREARDRRADLALGYSSWAEYAGAEFAPHTAGLAAPIRRELVANLSVETDGSAALSTRQIAPAVGVSLGTVHSDQHSGVQSLNTSGEPPEVLRDATPALAPALHALHDVADEFGVDLEDGSDVDLADVDMTTGEIREPEPVKVKGLDGKTYERPVQPPKPRRRPITDSARDAGLELRKAVERVERITEDDRFGRNKEEVASLIRGHLNNTIKVCQDLLDRI